MQKKNKTKQNTPKPNNNGNLSRSRPSTIAHFVSNSELKLKIRITELKESVKSSFSTLSRKKRL